MKIVEVLFFVWMVCVVEGKVLPLQFCHLTDLPCIMPKLLFPRQRGPFRIVALLFPFYTYINNLNLENTEN